MKQFLLGLVITLVAMSSAAFAENLDYNDFGTLRSIKLVDSIIMVDLVVANDSALDDVLLSFPQFDTAHKPVKLLGNMYRFDVLPQTDVEALLLQLNTDARIWHAARAGFDENGEETYFTNEFQIKLADGVDVGQAVARGDLNNDTDIDFVTSTIAGSTPS